MGCSFDSFSDSWSDRTYEYTLLVVAWIIPCLVIFISHLSIIRHVRKSNIRNLCRKKFPCRISKEGVPLDEERNGGTDVFEPSCTDNRCLPHVARRVSYPYIDIMRNLGSETVHCYVCKHHCRLSHNHTLIKN